MTGCAVRGQECPRPRSGPRHMVTGSVQPGVEKWHLQDIISKSSSGERFVPGK